MRIPLWDGFNFRHKMMIFIVVLMIGFYVVLSWISIGYEHKLMEMHFVEMYRTDADNLAATAAYTLARSDRDTLAYLITRKAQNRAITSIGILDCEGRPLIHAGDERGAHEPAVSSHAQHAKFREVFPLPTGWLHEAGHRYRITSPVVHDGKQFGTLYVDVTTQEVNRKVAAHAHILIKAIFGAFVVQMLVLIGIDQNLKRIFFKLTTAAKRMSAGNLSERVDIRTKDELETLGRAFNQMAMDLEHKDRKLTEYTKGLEAEVRDRTQELESERKKLEGIVSAIGGGIWLLDRNLRIGWANSKCLDLCHGRDALIGRPCHEMLWGETRACEDCATARTFAHGRIYSMEKHRVMPSGRKQVFRVTASPVTDQRGEVTHVVELIQEVTEEKQLTEQLHQAAKLAAIGELAGGVAHEVNNPAGIILAKAELCLESYGSKMPTKLKRDLIKIARHAGQIANITRALLHFARPSSSEKACLTIEEVIAEPLDMVSYSLEKSGVRLTLEIADDLPSIRGNQQELQQVILNLVNNASDAMPDGGQLRIAAALDDTGGAICIRIEDTGTGIPEDHMDRIFDPFFSTKAIGKGTGLGLSVSHGIIADHGGRIEVKNREGMGVVFTILLPAVHADATECTP